MSSASEVMATVNDVEEFIACCTSFDPGRFFRSKGGPLQARARRSAPKIDLRNAPYITGTGRKMFELPIPSTFSVVPSAMARESTVGDVGAFHYAYRR